MDDRIIASGKRKTSVARAVLTKGDGRITINKKDYKQAHFFDKLKIEEPLRITKNFLGNINFNVEISVRGGGEKSQIEATRLALARAIIQFNKSNSKAKDFDESKSKELEEMFIRYDRNLLVADVRRKEHCKPGDSKARAKRQTSYR